MGYDKVLKGVPKSVPEHTMHHEEGTKVGRTVDRARGESGFIAYCRTMRLFIGTLFKVTEALLKIE